MIARIAEHNQLPPNLDPKYVARHRAWMADQPGFCGGYHLLEPESGRALSLTIWENEAALAAAEDAQSSAPALADGRISREGSPSIRVVRVEAIF